METDQLYKIRIVDNTEISSLRLQNRLKHKTVWYMFDINKYKYSM